MGVDVLDILNKSRVTVEDLEVEVSGERAEMPPRYFRSIDLVYRVKGPQDGDLAKLERAVQLSRDKYCSVLHTLRSDLNVGVRIERA
jgi:putative redox protein